MTKLSKSVEDKIALERHDTSIKMAKSAFTIGCILVFVLFILAAYASFKTGEYPTMADVVELLSSVVSSALQVL